MSVVLAAVMGMTAVVAAAETSGASADVEGPRSFVLRAGRVITADRTLPFSFQPGVIVVRDGHIEAVGSDISIPPDLPLYEEPDATVLPGFVSAASSLVPEHGGDESMAAGYYAVDAFQQQESYVRELAGGVTTVHLTPGGHRLVTGQGAVVKLGGAADERVLIPRADLVVSFDERAFAPPRDVEYQTPASSDVAIPPAVRQRPDSRMGRVPALEEAIEQALGYKPLDFVGLHGGALRDAWRNKLPLRLHADRGVDILAALDFLKAHERSGYLVGGAQAGDVAAELGGAGVPLVYQLASVRETYPDLGTDPDAFEADVTALGQLGDVVLALAPGEGEPVEDLRLAAATAQRAGLTPQRIIEALTRIPAEILGVADRVGSLVPGKDADFVVWAGDPLSTSAYPSRVYVEGVRVFEAPRSNALVVRAGKIWVSDSVQISGGAVLIEEGKIKAVGTSVPHPPFARMIDAGPDAFVTPGLIDAHGHLGLENDHATASPDISLALALGVADVTDTRVARAGVTSVMLAPYESTGQGAQISAVKTGGATRARRTTRATAGVYFDMANKDVVKVESELRKRLEAGKKYLEKWTKFEKELAEWKEKMARGETVKNGNKAEETKEKTAEADPITGTWAVTISGGPIPEPQNATMRLRLTGQDIEGRIAIPGAPEEAKFVATLDGTHISGEIQIDTGGMGYPTIEADIVEEDHIVGIISFQGIEIDLDATRTDKSAVEFKVVKRRTRGKDGRPLPPDVDESLEPLRALLTGKIPAVVTVHRPDQIDAVLELAKEFEIAIVLRDAEGASVHKDALKERQAGVILPRLVERWRLNERYRQADDLARAGVPVAFQSNAEDGARRLPLVALRAVERGMSPDAALAALTSLPAKMFKLDDRIGSLQVGRDGDLVIFSGHPFAAGSRVERVIINGEEVR